MDHIMEDLPELNEILILDKFEEDMIEVNMQRLENLNNISSLSFEEN